MNNKENVENEKKETKNIKHMFCGLVCDNPNCDYENPEVAFEDFKDWVDRPCPKCGENLLTEEDYHISQALNSFTELFNLIPKDSLEKYLEERKNNLSEQDSGEFRKLLDEMGVKDKDKISLTVKAHKGIEILSVNKIEGEKENSENT